MNLSKTAYCRGLRCPKILWLDHHRPEEKHQTPGSEAVFATGTKVGELARSYFGKYSLVEYSADKSRMIAETTRLIKAGTQTLYETVICEASFSHDGNFCSVDILRPVSGGYQIIEVKSSTGMKDTYLDDMAFQYHVVRSCGLAVTKVSLMHINNQYVRHQDNIDLPLGSIDGGPLEIDKLFTLHDCTAEVLAKQKEIPAAIERLKAAAAAIGEDETPIGTQCGEGPSCDYHDYCFCHIPPNSVFDISGNALHNADKVRLYRKGLVTFDQLLASGETLSPAARLQMESEINKLPPHIDHKAIGEFLATLCYPLYFLDFETFSEAVPTLDGQRPYMQMPFQYSLHIQETEGAKPEHREFLAQAGCDPRRALAERLCADIPPDVCVLAYYMSFEKDRIAELAAAFPDLAAHLMSIHGNLHDLIIPFKSGAYYHREMRGSNSLKAVLPALFPNDPELDYHALDLIHNGGEAMNAFPELLHKSPEEQARIRAALLAYCRLDTLAMVKILEELRGAVL